MTATARHPDVLDTDAALAYIGLHPGACVSASAARKALTKLIADGHLRPLPLPGRKHMFHRADCDFYVAQLSTYSGNPAAMACNGTSAAHSHQQGHPEGSTTHA